MNLRHLVLLSPKTDNHVSAILTLDVSPCTCSITLGDTVLPQWPVICDLSKLVIPCHLDILQILWQCVTPGPPWTSTPSLSIFCQPRQCLFSDSIVIHSLYTCPNHHSLVLTSMTITPSVSINISITISVWHAQNSVFLYPLYENS